MLMRVFAISAIVILVASCAGPRSSKIPRQVSVKNIDGSELVRRVHFATGSDGILRRDRPIINQNAAWMLKNPNAFLILEGHCDERGGEEFNLRLGDRRARSVKAAMIESGAAPDSMAIVSHGEARPMDIRHNHEAWRINRRVEFVLR